MLKHAGFKLVIIILMVLMVDTLSAPPLSAAPGGCTSGFQPSANYIQSDIKALLTICGSGKHQVEWRTPQGTHADCHPYGGGGCAVANAYDALGNLVGTTWEFYIAGQRRPSGTYTAIVSTCNNYIGSTCIGWVESFSAHFNISGASASYTISGNAGTAAATLSYVDGATQTATADGTGNYTISIPSGWSGTVTPSKTGFTFAPVSKPYANVSADQPAQDYTATVPGNYSIYVPLQLTAGFTFTVPSGWSATGW